MGAPQDIDTRRNLELALRALQQQQQQQQQQQKQKQDDKDQKQEIIHKLTETMVGIEGEALRPVTWVTVEEVESGDWGIGGRAMTAQDVKDLQASAT